MEQSRPEVKEPHSRRHHPDRRPVFAAIGQRRGVLLAPRGSRSPSSSRMPPRAVALTSPGLSLALDKSRCSMKTEGWMPTPHLLHPRLAGQAVAGLSWSLLVPNPGFPFLPGRRPVSHSQMCGTSGLRGLTYSVLHLSCHLLTPGASFLATPPPQGLGWRR